MIVRISSEGQFRLDSDEGGRLNEMDNELVERISRGDGEGFSALYAEMLQFVRQQGERLGDDELVESEVILPPPDLTLDEARRLFQGEGLVPD